MIKLKMHFVFV